MRFVGWVALWQPITPPRIIYSLLSCLAISLPAQAETRSLDGSAWAVNGNQILLRVIVPDQVWQKIPGKNGGAITATDLGPYILAHYGATSSAGNCSAVDLGFDLGKITPMALTAGQRRYEALLRCPTSTGITLTDTAFFTEIPGHRGAVSITIDNAAPIRQEFSASHPQIALPAAPLSSFHETAEGFSHFWHSIDLVLFTLGLLALCGLKRDLLFPTAGFALGAAFSLTLAGTNFADPASTGWVAAYLLVLLAGELTLRHHRRAILGLAILSLLIALAAAIRHQPWPIVAAFPLLGIGYLRWRTLQPATPALWLIPAALLGIAEGLNDWPDLAFFNRPALLPLGTFDLGTLLGAASLTALCWLARRRVRAGNWSPILAAALAGAGSYLVLARL